MIIKKLTNLLDRVQEKLVAWKFNREISNNLAAIEASSSSDMQDDIDRIFGKVDRIKTESRLEAFPDHINEHFILPIRVKTEFPPMRQRAFPKKGDYKKC